MKRIDFLAVPGTGKTTTVDYLRKIRRNTSDFLLSEEAYAKAISNLLHYPYRPIDKLRTRIPNNKICKPFKSLLGRIITSEWYRAKSKFEEENLFDHIAYIWKLYPELMDLRLSGLGKHTITQKAIDKTEYLNFFYNTALRMKQLKLIEDNFSDKVKVIYDKSVMQMVFFTVDFSRRVDTNIIRRYINGIPRPAVVVILSAPIEVIVKRIRHRAEEGWVGTLHEQIIDTDILEKWVSIACNIVDDSRLCLYELGINVLEIDARNPPEQSAKKIQEYLRSIT